MKEFPLTGGGKNKGFWPKYLPLWFAPQGVEYTCALLVEGLYGVHLEMGYGGLNGYRICTCPSRFSYTAHFVFLQKMLNLGRQAHSYSHQPNKQGGP